MTKSAWAIIASALAMLFQIDCAAAATVITHCGHSEGMTFTFGGGLTPADKGEWRHERVAGNFELVAGDNNGDLDITYDGPLGNGSYKADGADVVVLPGGPSGFIVVVALQPESVDHYLFNLDTQGNGTVAWGSSRASKIDQRSTLMTASCDGSR